jgi:hypothetical protein
MIADISDKVTKKSSREDYRVVADIQQRFIEYYNFYTDEKARIEENRQFYSGIQLSSKQVEFLKQRGREMFIFNHIRPQILTVSGNMRLNRFDAVAKPVDRKSQSKSVIANYLLQHFKQNSNLSFLEPRVFESAIVDMFGVYEIRLIAGNDFKQDFKVFRGDPLNYYIDIGSKEDDLSDAERIFKDAWLTKEQLCALYPDSKERIMAINIDETVDNQNESSVPSDTLIESSRRSIFFDVSGKFIRTVEMWHKKWKNQLYIFNPESGKLTKVDEKYSKENVRKLTTQDPQLELFNRREAKLWLSTIAGTELVEDKEYPVQVRDTYGNVQFPFVFNWCYKEGRYKQSLAEDLKDYNRAINNSQSTMLRLLKKQADGSIVAEETAIDIDQWRKNPDIRFIKGINRFKEMKNSEIPAGFLQYNREIISDMESVGQSRQMQGQSQYSNTSGSLYQKQVQQANVRLLSVLDFMRLAKKLLNQQALEYYKQVYTEEQEIRVIGEDGKVDWMKINSMPENSINDMNAEIIIDEASSSANAKEYYVSVMGQIFQTMVQGGVPAQLIPWDLYLEGMDAKNINEIVDRLRKNMQRAGMMGAPQPQAGGGQPGGPGQGGLSPAVAAGGSGGGQNMTPISTPQQFAQGGMQ